MYHAHRQIRTMQEHFCCKGDGKQQEVNQDTKNKGHNHFCGGQCRFTDRN